MGKVTGFLEYERLTEAAEDKNTRTKHFREFVGHLSDEQAGVQGARWAKRPQARKSQHNQTLILRRPWVK